MQEHYRPEIDGLRALAVLAVVVFHLDRAWLPGGFVGVDVFFVISGFLITSILLRDLEAGTFSFIAFYQRRIARIFPALVVMSVVTLLAARLLYDSWDYAATGAAFSASLLSIANVHLLMQGDYFQLSADTQPLLHCWSLAVEEQFYVLFPFGLWMMQKLGKRRITVLLWVTVVSLLGSALMTAWKPAWAFYMLPTRAWELLLGSLLAMWHPSEGDLHPKPLLVYAGLAMIVASFVWLREGPWFPGWIALVPVLGSAFVVRYAVGGAGKTLLGGAVVASLGRVSYSLYLWHWPIFSFVDYTLLFQSPAVRFFLKVFLSLVATWMSYRFIERPCRLALNQYKRRLMVFAGLAAVMVLFGPLGYAIRRQNYIDASDGREGSLVFAPKGEWEGTIVLMGDSQATMYGKMLLEIARKKKKRLVVLSTAGEDPLANVGEVQSALWQTCRETVAWAKPEALVIACHWAGKLKRDPSRLEETLNAVMPHAQRVILITMPPELPKEAERPAIRDGSRPPFYETAEDRAAREEANGRVRAATSDSVRVVNVDPVLVDADGALRVFDSGGRSLFYDRLHLSGTGVGRIRAMLEGALDEP